MGRKARQYAKRLYHIAYQNKQAEHFEEDEIMLKN